MARWQYFGVVDGVPGLSYSADMNAIVKEIIGRASHWPEEDQEELAQVALEIELRRSGVYHASADELSAIDAALAGVARGGIASDAEVDALFGKYRRA